MFYLLSRILVQANNLAFEFSFLLHQVLACVCMQRQYSETLLILKGGHRIFVKNYLRRDGSQILAEGRPRFGRVRTSGFGERGRKSLKICRQVSFRVMLWKLWWIRNSVARGDLEVAVKSIEDRVRWHMQRALRNFRFKKDDQKLLRRWRGEMQALYVHGTFKTVTG